MLAIGFIDVQDDFMSEHGSLYVQGAADLKKDIITCYDGAVDADLPMFFTADDHVDSDAELKRNGGPFEDHCMRGTAGQRFIIPELEDGIPVFTKNGYDVFDLKLGSPNIRRWLTTEGITQVVLVGVAFDYCVKAAAIGLSDMGILTVVASDLTKGIADETIKDTLMEFHRRGIGYAPFRSFSLFSEANY